MRTIRPTRYSQWRGAMPSHRPPQQAAFFMPIYRICPEPGCRTLVHTGRCPNHKLPPRGRQHRRVRAQVLLNTSHCWICGQPPTPDDPLTLDHVIPRAHGGPTTIANGRAAHRSCNSRRGAAA